jgi:hypothetical protein
MQKYRGIVMGRRKINNSETEIEIERSGDDHEPQGLEKFDENLQKMNENQTRITDLLMQVTHRGKDPNMYGNKEARGFGEIHEEFRCNPEKAPGSEGSLGGGMFHG